MVNRALKRISDHFATFALLAYLLPFIYYFLLTLRDGDINFLDWKKTQYLVNYFDYGLIKRGLVGNLFILIPLEQIKYYIVLFHASLFVLLTWLIARLTDKRSDAEGTAKQLDWLRALFVLSPFTSLQIGFDIGRYDLLNLILLVLSVKAIQEQKFFLTALMTACALLTHEAYVFYGLPLIFALTVQKVWVLKADTPAFQKTKLTVVIYAISLLCVCILMYLFGSQKKAISSSAGLGQQVWNRDLLEPSFGATMSEMIILIAILALIYVWLISFYATNRAKPDILLLSSVPPLALFFLGVDYARWSALIFITALLIVYHKVTVDRWHFNHWLTRSLGLLFFLPLGPIGIERFFPFLAQIFPLFRRFYS